MTMVTVGRGNGQGVEVLMEDLDLTGVVPAYPALLEFLEN